MSGQYLEGVMAELAKASEVKTDTVLTGRIIELEARLAALKSAGKFECMHPVSDSACDCCQRRFLRLDRFVDADRQYVDTVEQQRVWLIQEGLDPNTGRRVMGNENSKATHLLFDAIVAREDAARCRILIGLAEFAGRSRFEDVDACPWCNGPQLPLEAPAHRDTCPAFSARGVIR